MRTRKFQQMLILVLALLVSSGAGARVADDPKSPTKFELIRAESSREVAQTADPLVVEGEKIDLQSAAATDWSDIAEAQYFFDNWLRKVFQERQKRNDPEYLKQREESISGELARTKKIRMEKDAKICRKVESIEFGIKAIKIPIAISEVAITVAWNKQFASSVLKDIAFALNKCWEWQGKVSSLVSKDGVEINIELNVVFRPVREVQSSVVIYNMTILDELGLGFTQPSKGCQSKLLGQTTTPQGVILYVNFENFDAGKLSYFSIGSSTVNTSYECDGKSAPISYPLVWLFSSADGKFSKPIFIDNPSNTRIKGSVSSKGMTASWDLQRQAPQN
jgi:hypothetical protein